MTEVYVTAMFWGVFVPLMVVFWGALGVLVYETYKKYWSKK